ncbi:hypothetical protein A4A49_28383 [Nicotiana attenuata]|uniref:DUF4283 domain-containing protein n=1 Tax=Nicotiana attenuata TaxID=49451 RepID=A0A1J6KPN2_NICAT|nr:hypothetical protein A4A49_28383 [Nicotiana attenuata]
MRNADKSNRRGSITLPYRPYSLFEGKPVVTFTKEENDLLAQTCKWTVIGKLTRIRPSIELIRSDFAKSIPGKGNIKIGAYDMHHIFIDFDNKEDHSKVIARNYMTFGKDNTMVIQKWFSFIQTGCRLVIHSVWITLPNLQWHYYEWGALCRILGPVGIPLIMDKATMSKIRPTTAKVRVEINLAKPIVQEVLLEFINGEGSKEMVVQKIEYESIPAFCTHCKMRGHSDATCRILHPELKKEVGRKVNNLENTADSNKTTQEINHHDTSKKGENQQTIRVNTRAPTTKLANTVPNNQMVPEEIMIEVDDEEGWKTVENKRGKRNASLKTKDTESKQGRIQQAYKVKDGQKSVVVTHNTTKGNRPISFFVTVVYAKCDEQLRNILWDDLRATASSINGPWGVVGDFNVISSGEEKIGGRDFRVEESLDFISCLSDCELQDGGYVGTSFTWSDNIDPPNTIWKRLDRLVYNTEWFDLFGGTSVTHMSRSCSDHSPLLIACGSNPPEQVRYFKFLNFWVDHEEYLNVIQQSWLGEDNDNPLYNLHQKIKRVCSALSSWSRTAFGDIYEEPKKLEMEIRRLEEVYLNDNNQSNRLNLSKAKAEFTRYLKLQDSVLRQKARVKWADLIRQVLLAINTHTLAAVHPPKGSLDMIEKFIARFFWSGQEEGEDTTGSPGLTCAILTKRGELLLEGLKILIRLSQLSNGGI